MTKLTFKTFLVEGAKERTLIKRLAASINSKDAKLDAKMSSKEGSLEQLLAITTPDGKFPATVLDIFKVNKIGVGDKAATKNEDGTTTIKFYVVEL